MENLLKLVELFSTIVEQNDTIVEQNKMILEKMETSHFSDKKPLAKFDVPNQSKACRILNCSIPTLRKAINNNILIEDIHYRCNTNKTKYFFSSSALQTIKGKI